MFERLLKAQSLLIFMLGMMVYSPSAYSQVSEAQARDLLAQRGIPEDTLKARLIAKGYDPDNISPDQLENFQVVILETVKEIEADKNN
ncbi:MAG: hypothetical protein IPL92_10070 [Saprospiraceae bacterium]|nr:hypothetical protein [Candidatus Opimibacter iunctus]